MYQSTMASPPTPSAPTWLGTISKLNQRWTGPPNLIYYGTAAQRSPANRPGLEHLLVANPRHRFFDVNLREDCYTPQTVRFGLEAATIVKLNDEEWEAVRDIAAVAAPADLLARYALDCLAITLWRRPRSAPHSGGLVRRTAGTRVRRRCGRSWRRL